jgi:beta-lactamase regulating signal transducer with metallopeptidase domain
VFALVPRPEPASAVATAASGPAIDAVSWAPLALAAYIAGAAIVFSLVLLSMIRVARLRRASRAASDATRQLTTSLAGLIGVRRRVTVVVSDNAVAAPIAIGILKPAVVVPRTLEESLDPGELRAVIGHELAHHRRGDLLWAWVRSAACTIWWWHPAVWMVSKALRHVQEELCDDEVIRAGVIERDAYCDVLLRAAAIGAPLGAGAAFGDRRHPLADRVERLLSGQGSARVRPLVARATTVALACALLPGVRHEAVKAVRASAAGLNAPVSAPAMLVKPMESSDTAAKSAPLKRSHSSNTPQNAADAA